MNYFDDENKIIEWLQEVDSPSVCFPIENDEVIAAFESIYDEVQWRLWKNSSDKSDPPPDFYCDELKLMMDVMRVDDHAFKNKKGKVVNPTNARESQKQRELRESGILDLFPNVANVIVNAVTDLPTEEDHNYKFYKNNFIRTIEEHKRKISLYKQNHPDFKTIFLVCDESSAYIEAENVPKIICEEMAIAGRLHIWFWDKLFMQAFANSDIDYLIWYAPFKLYRNCVGDRIDFPQVAVFDTKFLIEKVGFDYVIDKMVSSEV